MVVCAETYAKQVLDLRPTDRVFSIAKLYFAYGLGNAGYFPMSVGAQSVLHPRPAHARPGLRGPGAPPPHGVLRRPHALRGAARRQGPATRHDLFVAATVRVGRRGAAPRSATIAGATASGSSCWTGSGPRDPPHLPVEPPGRRPARLDRAARCRATRPSSWTTRGGPSPTGRSATCASGATPPWRSTGTSTTRPGPPCSASGSRPGTSTTVTPTATSGTAAAPTTC